jgi:hypothetical protein
MNHNNSHPELAPGQNKTITVIVNGRPKEVTGKTLNYREVIQLAYPNDPVTNDVEYTVAYANPHGKDGTLVDGQDVHVKEGMVFNVRKTNRS